MFVYDIEMFTKYYKTNVNRVCYYVIAASQSTYDTY